MADPIHSASWTGPPESMSAPGRVFTHRLGTTSVTGDYARFAEHARLAALMSPEHRRVMRLAAWLLISPISLWVGTLILDGWSSDLRIAGRGDQLLLWGLGAVLVGGLQLTSRSARLLMLKQLLFPVGILGISGLAIGNVYFGLRSNAQAIASAPERVYIWSGSSGRGAFKLTIHYFQRADGSFIDGRDARAPVDYGRQCGLVQRLDGPDGYAFVRVLDRSRDPGNAQIDWPIRRAECFSDIPLSTLPR